jgi:two-component sensor histidine kinase
METIIGGRPLPENQFTVAHQIAEANHRIANSLSVLVGMVRMQAAAVKKKGDSCSSAEVRHLLDGIAARINAISQLHRIISHAGTDGVISLKPHLHEVTDALLTALSSREQAVKVIYAGGDCIVQARQIQPIVLILCEIFINAMKYAHPTGVPLIMLVDSSIGGDGRLVLTVSDDGVGLPEGFDPMMSSGMGFKVMRRLAAEVGGELQIQSTHLGLSCRLSLPAMAMTGMKLA